jgi:hypothetical protein
MSAPTTTVRFSRSYSVITGATQTSYRRGDTIEAPESLANAIVTGGYGEIVTADSPRSTPRLGKASTPTPSDTKASDTKASTPTVDATPTPAE